MRQPDFTRFCRRYRPDIISDIKEQCNILGKDCFIGIENGYSVLIGKDLRKDGDTYNDPIVVIEHISDGKVRNSNIRISIILNVPNSPDFISHFYAYVNEADLSKKKSEVVEDISTQNVSEIDTTEDVSNEDIDTEISSNTEEDSTNSEELIKEEVSIDLTEDSDKNTDVVVNTDTTTVSEDTTEENTIELTEELVDLYNRYLNARGEFTSFREDASMCDGTDMLFDCIRKIRNCFDELNAELVKLNINDSKCDIVINYDIATDVISVSMDTYVRIGDYFIDKQKYTYNKERSWYVE